jgi:hypothetical protein
LFQDKIFLSKEDDLMPEEFKAGCQRPPVKKISPESTQVIEESTKEVEQTLLKVGKPAPEFAAPAFYQGKFVNTNLSEYKGKWLLVCFYPGDFTFV